VRPLVELEPQFVIYVGDRIRSHVATFAEAQGIYFLCPVHAAPGYAGPNAGHIVEVSFAGRGVADDQGSHDIDGRPSRWSASGSSYADLTLQPSIDISRGGSCTWHGFVTAGIVT
jgi:hypothetical protein